MQIEEIPYYENGKIKSFYVEDNNIYTTYYVDSKKTNKIKEIYTKENYEIVQKEYLSTLEEYLNRNIIDYNVVSDKYEEIRDTKTGRCRVMIVVGLIFMSVPFFSSIINDIYLLWLSVILTPMGFISFYVGNESLKEHNYISRKYNKYNELRNLYVNMKRKTFYKEKDYQYSYSKSIIKSNKLSDKLGKVKKKIRRK